jgi:hypothetical protein
MAIAKLLLGAGLLGICFEVGPPFRLAWTMGNWDASSVGNEGMLD